MSHVLTYTLKAQFRLGPGSIISPQKQNQEEYPTQEKALQ